MISETGSTVDDPEMSTKPSTPPVGAVQAVRIIKAVEADATALRRGLVRIVVNGPLASVADTLPSLLSRTDVGEAA